MKLGSLPLERALRRRVYERLGTPFWKRWRRRRGRAAAVVWGHLASAMVAMLLLSAVLRQGARTDLSLISLALFAAFLVVVRVSGLTREAYHVPDVFVLSSLPIADADVFRIVWRKSFVSSAPLFTVFAATLMVVALVNGEGLRGVGLAVLLAAAEWLLILSISTLLASAGVRPRYTGIVAGLVVLSLIAFAVQPQFFAVMLSPVTKPALRWMPQAWPLYVFREGVLEGDLSAWLTLIPVALIIFTAPAALKRLAGSFAIKEYLFSGSMEHRVAIRLNDHSGRQLAKFLMKPESFPMDEEEAAAHVAANLNRHSSAMALWWRGGFLERIVAALLTERERTVADFMLRGRVMDVPRTADSVVWWSWSKGLRRGTMLLAVALCIGLFLLNKTPVAVVIGFGIATMMAAPVFGGGWSIFDIHGGSLPAFCLFPIGFGEMSRVMLKANIVRILAWSPAVFVTAGLVCARWGFPVPLGLLVAAKLVLLLLSIQPLMIVGAFSNFANARKGPRLQAVTVVSLQLIGLGFVIGSMIMMFFPHPIPAMIGSAMLPVSCASMWFFYSFVFHRGRLDIRVPEGGEPAGL